MKAQASPPAKIATQLTSLRGPALQRKCACGQHTPGGGECAGCHEKKGTLQRAAAGSAAPEVAPPIVHEVLRSGGQPLDRKTRAFMEPRFGQDFSRVRVHTGARAAESARAVGALGYTVGSDVVFGDGQYRPRVASGQRLLAHELAHVVQGSAPGGAPSAKHSGPLEVGAADDPREREADTAAARVAAEQPAALDAGSPGTVGALRRQTDGDAGADGTSTDTGTGPAIPAMSCVPLTAPGHPDDSSSLSFPIESAGLTPVQKKAISLFHQSWADDGQNDFIIIDGYASVDGPVDYNWRLSCRRAEAVQTELINEGVPASRVITFAHGPTKEFSATDPTKNRRAVLSTIVVPGPTDQGDTAAVPNADKVTTVKEGEIDDKGNVKKDPEVKTSPTSTQDVPVKKAENVERRFSVTYEADIQNVWSLHSQPNDPHPPPFLCDHGIFQLGAKWNFDGLSPDGSRWAFFTEPELDVNVVPAFCNKNPGVTAQINLVKFNILGKLLEADLVGVLGLPDGWSSNVPDFPFTGGFQVKGQWMPFGNRNDSLKNLKVVLTGILGGSQGVGGQNSTWSVGGSIGIAHEFDFGPKKPKDNK